MERAKPILTQPGSVPSFIHHAWGSTEVTTLSNTIDYEQKSTDFWNRPFPHGLTH